DLLIGSASEASQISSSKELPGLHHCEQLYGTLVAVCLSVPRGLAAKWLRSQNRSRRVEPQGCAILGPPTPKCAIALGDEGQALVIAGQGRVFRQLELFLCRIPAFAFLAELLHLGRSLLQQRQLVLSV